MSEEKSIQHLENVVQSLSDKKKSWKTKLKEIIKEILIIVFAVTITLALHNWNDHRKERKIEKDFLIGIKSDLQKAKENLEIGFKDFQPTINYYDTVANQIFENRVNAVYIDTNSGYLINTSYFIFDNGRFEGFKSSGYLRLIENQELQKKIISLYTVTMPFEEETDKHVFRTREQDFNTYIGIKAPLDKNGLQVSKIINDPSVKYQIVKYTGYFEERKSHKKKLVKEIETLISLIDKELNNM